MESASRCMQSIDVGSEATTPKPPKASEKRRQQNRLAQRNYREKQKKRLQTLERLAISVVTPELSNGPHPHSASDLASPLPLPGFRDSRTPNDTNLDYFSTTESANDEIGVPWRLSGQELPSALPSTAEVQSTHADFLPSEGTIATPFEAEWSLCHWSIGQDVFLDTETNLLAEDVPNPAPIQSVMMPSGVSSSDSSSNLLDPRSSVIPGSLEYTLHVLSEELLRPGVDRLSKDTVGTPGNNLIAPNRNITLAGRSQHMHDQNLEHACLPNLYANHIRIHTISLISACKANALHLGISEVSFCSEDSESFFYRPRLTESAHRDILITAVQNTFQGIKHDLRPQPAQITISHHPYIDCIPFPSLRERVIELQAHDPSLIDEDELLHDILKGGMVCWGGCMPAKRTSAGGGGAPWDMRSWEAMEWFLEKWAFVVGDMDGEVWRQTKWWRDMRGD